MKDFFDKTDYTGQDIHSLIENRIEESLYLDFKKAGALVINDKCKDEIAKDVSSFANSDGGVIIYGIAEENHVASELSFIDGNEITKEWIEQVINGKIQRRLDFNIYPIRFDTEIAKTVYVVKIPASSNTPHMSSDKRYYRRYNFEAVRMEEYEVRNMYSRVLKTVLRIEPIIQSNRISAGNSLTRSLTFEVRNIGMVIEKDYKLEILIPEEIYESSFSNPIKEFFIRQERNYKVYSIPNKSPIFQDEKATLGVAWVKTLRGVPYNTGCKILMRLYYTGGKEEKEEFISNL